MEISNKNLIACDLTIFGVKWLTVSSVTKTKLSLTFIYFVQKLLNIANLSKTTVILWTSTDIAVTSQIALTI